MNSSMCALAGDFVSTWRVLIDVDGEEENEITLTFNAKGWSNMVSHVESAGYNIDQILDYTMC
jgi:hypothetical protein